MLPFLFPHSRGLAQKFLVVLGLFSLAMQPPALSAVGSSWKESTLVDSTYESIHWYYEGLRMRENRQYDKAVKAFTRFLSENPDHVYADRAQFMIFDAHFKNQDYALALADSSLFENRFVDSSKYPEVLYQRALSFLSLGRKKEAKNTLETLVKLFPGKEITGEAQGKLLSLNGETP